MDKLSKSADRLILAIFVDGYAMAPLEALAQSIERGNTAGIREVLWQFPEYIQKHVLAMLRDGKRQQVADTLYESVATTWQALVTEQEEAVNEKRTH